MTIADQIARIAGTLPESLASETLDFVRFLQARALPAGVDTGRASGKPAAAR